MSLARLLVVLCVLTGAVACPGHGQITLRVPLEQLERDARIDSTDADAQYDLGLGYWGKKRYEDADRALRRAVAIDPRHAAAYLALAYLPFASQPRLLKERVTGKLHREMRDVLMEAERLGRRAFLLDPLVDVRIIGVASRKPSRGVSPWSGNPFEAFMSGNYMYTFNALSSAIERARASHDTVPDAFLWYRGLAAGHLGLYPRTIADLTVLLERAQRFERSDTIQLTVPVTTEYRYFMAFFLHKAQRFAEAIDLYREALGQDAGLFMAHVQLGRLYESHQLWDEAVNSFELAVGSNPDDASLLVDLGLAQWAADRFGAAETTLVQAQDANRLDSRVPYYLGLLQLLRADSVHARASLTRFLALAPRRLSEQITNARSRLAQLTGPP